MKTILARRFIMLVCLVASTIQANAAAEIGKPGPAEPAYQRYEGFTHPSRELRVESRIDGVLETLHVQAGDRFDQGDVLLSMDASIQVLAVEVARLQSESTAEIEAAEARVVEAQTELDSQNDLAKAGSATPRDIRRAEARVTIAEAELDLAIENKRLAVKQYKIEQERLKLYTFESTFAGEVIAVATAEGAEEGAALRQNDPIMHLAQLDPLIAKLSLPESAVKQLKVGSHYPLGVGQGAEPTLAKLKRIASVADRGSQLIEVEFEISNPESKTRSGVRCRLLDIDPLISGQAKD